MTDTGPGSIPPQSPQPQPQPAPGSAPPPSGPVDYATPATSGAYAGPPATPDDKTMGMLAHLLGIIGFLGPLIIWLIKKDQSAFVNDQGKEALNFQLTILIGWVAGIALNFVFCLGTILWIALAITNIIFCIMAAMKANQGIAYRYPFAIRFIK